MEKTIGETLISPKNLDVIHMLSNMAQSLSAGIEYEYNPILITGKSGTGKSYLLTKTNNALKEKSLFINGIDLLLIYQTKKSILSIYHDLEDKSCLIIDDIQHLSKEINIHDEVSYIIDTCIKKKISVLIGMNNDTNYLSENLQSRINMGINMHLHEPDLDIRTRYAHNILEENKLKSTKSLALTIARHCTKFRHIRSLIMNIKAFYERTGFIPDSSEIDDLLLETGYTITMNPELIINIVAIKYGYQNKDIKNNKREQKLVEARQISMYLCRHLLATPYETLGKIFGGKNHTTVIYACKKIEDLIVRNKDMHILVTELTKNCKKNFI